MTATDPPVVAHRRTRLRTWIDAKYDGVQANFVAATGINQGELSSLLRSKSFGEKRARSLEKQASMPIGYLDEDEADLDSKPINQQISTQSLTEIRQLLGLTAKAMACAIPAAGRDLVTEVERTLGPLRPGTFVHDFAEAVRAELPEHAQKHPHHTPQQRRA